MRYYIGVDGGGTSTVCYLANEYGKLVGRGEAGASSYHVTGIEAAKKEILTAVEKAVAYSGLKIDSFATACFGLSGIDCKTDYHLVYNMLVELDIADKIILENDAVIALAGANADYSGIVLIAGTGAIAYGIDKEGRRKRANGWGHLIGDEGSAYYIATQGMMAALKAYDGRGRDTLLLPLFKEHLRLTNMENIMEKVYTSMNRKDIAATAFVVFKAAQEGDEKAAAIIKKAGQELGRTIKAVISKLNFKDTSLEIPLVGGVFKSKSPLLLNAIKEEVLQEVSEVHFIEPKFCPAVGAVLIALKESKIALCDEILTNLRGG